MGAYHDSPDIQGRRMDKKLSTKVSGRAVTLVRKHLPTVLAAWGWIVGPDPESKRDMSGIFTTIGAVLVAVGVSLSPVSKALVWTGVVSFVLGFIASRNAMAQGRLEAGATDIIEWKREEQEFRGVLRRLWPSLKAAYGHYSEAHDLPERSLQTLVDEAGWPGSVDESGDLRTFVERCLSFDWGLPTHKASKIIPLREALGNDSGAMQLDIARLNELIEVWAIALDVGGSRAPALKEILRLFGKDHESTMRLLYYLTPPFVKQRGTRGEPGFEALDRVRAVMLPDLQE